MLMLMSIAELDLISQLNLKLLSLVDGIWTLLPEPQNEDLCRE